MRVKDLIEKLNRMSPDAHIAYDLWTKADVEEVADMNDRQYSDEQINDIIDTINCKKDASVGINWDVVETHVMNLPEKNLNVLEVGSQVSLQLQKDIVVFGELIDIVDDEYVVDVGGELHYSDIYADDVQMKED
jgi:hypothetical protein